MTHAIYLSCVLCDTHYPPEEVIFQCTCGGPLDVVYDYQAIRDYILTDDFRRQEVHHWKYWQFYPVTDLTKIVTMREGGTPLLQSKVARKVTFKVEGVNPTGSFKDRGSSLELTKAKEHKAKEVVCATTGNMGASIAAYAAQAGISCTAFVPTFAPKQKVKQIEGAGTKVVPVRGTYEQAVQKTLHLRDVKRVYLTGDYAFRGEGQKSVGFEIIDQLNWEVPDHIVVPVGNATLLSATHKALDELNKVGLIDDYPNIVGVQATGCNPLVKAWKSAAFKNFDGHQDIISLQKKPKTVASAIACGYPVDGIKSLKFLKKRGEMIAVSDREILLARKELGQEGHYVEPSGAVSYAGYKKLGLKGSVVCVLSGHGLKVLL